MGRRGRPKGYHPPPHNFYTVYRRKTDFPLIIGGTARECAAAMKVTLGSFHTIYTKQKNGHKKASRKWEIFRDDPGDMEIEE